MPLRLGRRGEKKRGGVLPSDVSDGGGLKVAHGLTPFLMFAGQLADGGTVLMPPGSYGFSRKFAWVNDRYGVSWQLNLRE